MARPHKCRRVSCRPEVLLFKPAGVPMQRLETIELRLDELEALRLADVEGLYQDAAAGRMGVSRATFGRLVADARHKVAAALLGPKAIAIQGGRVTMVEKRRFKCSDCGHVFEVPFGTGRPAACPQCSSSSFCRADAPGEGGRRRRRRACRRGGARGGAAGGGQGRRCGARTGASSTNPTVTDADQEEQP